MARIAFNPESRRKRVRSEEEGDGGKTRRRQLREKGGVPTLVLEWKKGFVKK